MKNIPNPKLLDKEWLYQRYVVEQFSMHKIADEIGVTIAVVSKYIKRYDFPIRSGGESKTITSLQDGPKNKFLADKEWLYQRYVVDKKSSREVAKEAGLQSRRQVRKALRLHNIPIRDLKEARNSRSSKGPEFRYTDNPLANDLDHIKELYDSGKSIAIIEEELGISKDAVQHRVKAAQIDVRDSWEHRIGTKHSEDTKRKMSDTASQQILDGTRSSFVKAIRMTCLTPNNGFIKTRSSWEKKYIEYLKNNSIDFYYEYKSFALSDGHTYVPDFYLPTIDTYIEIKGFLNDLQSNKYELFQQEFPHIKWKILYRDDLESMGIDLISKYPTIYMLCGAPGAGKSWVANQLLDNFNYISFDHTSKKDHLSKILTASNEKPILYDPNIKISTFIRRHSHEMNIIPIFIIEKADIIRSRIESRGGQWTEHIAKRIDVMDARNKKYGIFSGTSTEVLQYLRGLVI